MTICAECRRPITSVRLLDGTLVSIDTDPDVTGNITLTGAQVESPTGFVPQARRLDATIPLFDSGAVRHTAHTDHCPGPTHTQPIREESRQAQASIVSATHRDRTRIFGHLFNNGPRTDEQLVDELEMNPNSERPRRGELVHDGLVRKVGTGLTKSGRKAAVWAAVDGNGRVMA